MNPRVTAALDVGAESIRLHYGDRPQVIASIEEMGELIVQLSKRLNKKQLNDAVVVDEIADCFVMLSQLRLIFGGEKVDERILFKLNRTLETIRNKQHQGVDQ